MSQLSCSNNYSHSRRTQAQDVGPAESLPVSPPGGLHGHCGGPHDAAHAEGPPGPQGPSRAGGSPSCQSLGAFKDSPKLPLLAGARSTATVSALRSCRLPPAPGHGLLLPAGGLHQRRTPAHGIRHPGHDLLRLRPDGQGLGQDALRHLRELLQAHRASQLRGWRGGSWGRPVGQRWRSRRWRRSWRRWRRWPGRQALLGLQTRVLAEEHGAQLGLRF